MIGKSIEDFSSQLLREIDVLRLYFHLSLSLSESEKISILVKKIQCRYREAGISIKSTEAIRIKIKRLVASCKKLIKKRKICCNSNTERLRQTRFRREIHALFDGKKGDEQLYELNHQQEFSENTDSTKQNFIQPNDNENYLDIPCDPNISDDLDDDPSDQSDLDYVPSDNEYQLLPKREISDECFKQISKSKASYRVCEKLLKVGVRISGGDPNQYSISKSTIWKKNTDLRSDQRTQLLSSLAEDNRQIVIHFDGKSCRRLNARHLGNQERIIILCHTEQGDVPLGMFIVKNHTSLENATQILNIIERYNLKERIVGLNCDTENLNTGQTNGVCAEIERQLKKPLLHLMCRHHVFELVLKSVFEAIFGPTTGPNVTTFNILKESWNRIKNGGFVYAPLSEEQMIDPEVSKLAEETIRIIGPQAKIVRNDYAELNNLVLKFLGSFNRTAFHVPGATNNARWMSRAIYALKLYLFRNQIDLNPEFIDALERFCMFVSLIYIKFWNQSTNVTDAPVNDIEFLKEIEQYSQIDLEISNVALTTFQRHLWYLGDELVVLALFSDKVSIKEKIDMRSMLVQRVGQRTHNSIKVTDQIGDIQNLTLDQFMSVRSFFLLDLLQVDTEFLMKDPTDWNKSKSYCRAKRKIHDLITVVNDSAERALQLGAILIDNQKIRTETRLQDFLVSSHY